MDWTKAGPTPRGVGGLKYFYGFESSACYCPTPRGVGGLKSLPHIPHLLQLSPTPRGVGGLKYKRSRKRKNRIFVPPHAGWVD